MLCTTLIFMYHLNERHPNKFVKYINLIKPTDKKPKTTDMVYNYSITVIFAIGRIALLEVYIDISYTSKLPADNLYYL